MPKYEGEVRVRESNGGEHVFKPANSTYSHYPVEVTKTEHDVEVSYYEPETRGLRTAKFPRSRVSIDAPAYEAPRTESTDYSSEDLYIQCPGLRPVPESAVHQGEIGAKIGATVGVIGSELLLYAVDPSCGALFVFGVFLPIAPLFGFFVGGITGQVIGEAIGIEKAKAKKQ